MIFNSLVTFSNPLSVHNYFDTQQLYFDFKGIVSRDWGSLQIVLLDRYRVLDITTSSLFFKVVNIFKNLKM
jgi:hypothetical protein